MQKHQLIRTLLILCALVVGAYVLLPTSPDDSSRFDTGGPNASSSVTFDTIIDDVAVRDLDGRVAWQGSVDLQPTLDRIARGQADGHRGDGDVFENREGLLPSRPSGYYRKYVIRTPGIRHAGPQRLIIGRNGDVWYTHDHYRNFVAVRAADSR